jgi:hypothetical protein
LTTNSTTSLIGAAESADLEPSLRNMLGCSPGGSFPPQSKGRRFQLGTHQFDHLSRRESKLTLDGVKAGPVFPRHLDWPATKNLIHEL